MKNPDIALVHVDAVPRSVFSEFERLVRADNLDVRVESRPELGPMASMLWYVPTAIFVYISKSYFDGFLKEMGKEHYASLKAGIKSLYARWVGPEAPSVTLHGTKGKIAPEQPYSLVFSVVADAGNRATFKLLIQQGISESEYELAAAAFLGFLEAYHARSLDDGTLRSLREARSVGNTLLLAYDLQSNRIEPVGLTREPGA